MRRTAVAALTTIALAAAVAASAARPASPDVVAEAVLDPAIVLFGDELTAHVDVILDHRRVDPRSVRVEAEFTPWAPIAVPAQTRHEGEATTLVRTTFVLRCLISPCVPPRDTAPLRFDPAHVTYRVGGDLHTVEVEWPLLVVHSRLSSVDAERGARAAIPWRADVVSFPPVSYRLAPGLVLALLLVLGVLLALVGALLGYRALARRETEREAEPEPPPTPELTPLEHALALLEGRLAPNGAAEHRRALELVGEEIAAHDPALAGSARVLAWSKETPAVDVMSGIAARVRETLALEETGDGASA